LTWLNAHPTIPHAIHLTTVLSTPLMVALARIIYSDTPEHDPAELLDDTRFPTPDTLREHLFGAFLPAVYQRPSTGQYSNGHRRWGQHRARHHLTYLAIHLTHLRTYDLAWWELGNTLPRRTQILAGALTYGLAYALAYGLVGLVVGPPGWLVTGLVYGIAGMVGGGLALGLAHDEHKPAHIQPHLPGQRTKARKGLRVGLVVGLLLGTAYGVLIGLGNGRQVGLVYGAIFGLTIGLVSGIGIIVGLATPRDVKTAASPIDLLASDRKNTIRQLLVAIGVIGTVFAVAVAFFLGVVLGVVNGVALGVAFGAVAGLGFNAWGWWLVLARIWLPLTGRLPWQVLTFLDDAYQRGVLRQAGAVYQFRHARLQDHLTQTFQTHHDQQPNNSR
jgi:MFS family permease